MSAEELIDIVDEEDRVVGTATRAAMRRDRLWHRATYVLVFDKAGRLLVHLRSADKDVYPSHFDVAIGGVVGAGEDYATAAARELAEEIGVRGAVLRPIGRLTWEDLRNRVHGAIFTCVWEGPLRLQREEIVAAEWLPVQGLYERRRRDAFCPDGLAALDLYLRSAGDGPEAAAFAAERG